MTPTRVVQEGTGNVRDLVIVYHLDGRLDGKIKEAFGPEPCVVNITDAPFKGNYAAVGVGKLRPVEQVWADTKVAAQRGRLILIGFSEGCQGVRAHLKAGVKPDVVVVMDGTHSTMPVSPVDVAIWNAAYTRGKLGECLFVGTHSGLTYVENLKPPYASTHRILEMASGLALPLPHGTDTETRDGNAVILSNGDGDRDAHVRQCTTVLPHVIQTYVVPYLRSLDSVEVPETIPSPPRSLAERCVDWALGQKGHREQPLGSNDSPLIQEWRKPCVRGEGTQAVKLNLPPSNWCAMFVCATMKASLEPGEMPPHGYRAGVVEIVADAQSGNWSSRWHPISEVLTGVWKPEPGDLAIWDRSQPGKPETSWWRHINRIVEWIDEESRFITIGGNEGVGEVALAQHTFVENAKLLGFVEYWRPEFRAALKPETDERNNADLAAFMQEMLDRFAADHWGRDPSSDA